MISLNQIDLGNGPTDGGSCLRKKVVASTGGLYEIRIESLRLVMRKSDGYVNATKLCKDADKEYSNWKQNKGVDELISKFESILGIPRMELIQSKHGGNLTPSEQGTYVHPKIAIQIANWCSADFAVKVSDIIFKYYTGDLFLIPEIAQNFNATHEENKVTQVDITLSKREEIELEKERTQIAKLKSEINQTNLNLIERAIALLDMNEPREKIAAQSLKINAANYLQRSLGNSIEETKAPQEMPALQIIINQLVRIENKGLKSSVKLALEHFMMLVSKKIAQKYRELHNENPKQKLYVNDRGIEIVCNLYTTEDEQMIRETILNHVSEYNLKNKYKIVMRTI